MTVERVDPDNLAEGFGAGVFLKRATLELVDPGIWPFNWIGLSGVPLTTGIEKILPWLEVVDGGYLHQKFSARGSPYGLHGGHFERK